MNNIIDGLLAAMRRQGFKQGDLAERAGYDRKTVSEIKNGRGTRLVTIVDLGAVLGMELVWRAKRDDDI